MKPHEIKKNQIRERLRNIKEKRKIKMISRKVK